MRLTEGGALRGSRAGPVALPTAFVETRQETGRSIFLTWGYPAGFLHIARDSNPPR
jgi:hypothetical protein